MKPMSIAWCHKDSTEHRLIRAELKVALYFHQKCDTHMLVPFHKLAQLFQSEFSGGSRGGSGGPPDTLPTPRF